MASIGIPRKLNKGMDISVYLIVSRFAATVPLYLIVGGIREGRMRYANAAMKHHR